MYTGKILWNASVQLVLFARTYPVQAFFCSTSTGPFRDGNGFAPWALASGQSPRLGTRLWAPPPPLWALASGPASGQAITGIRPSALDSGSRSGHYYNGLINVIHCDGYFGYPGYSGYRGYPVTLVWTSKVDSTLVLTVLSL